MVDLNSTASISVLHADLLWKIFQDNVVPPHRLVGIGWTHRPLITARQCSQVCQEWRSILLQSSSIWARAIDLDYLNQKGGEWRKEVLSRTGKALLWVYGRASVSTMLTLAPFLEQNWGRVQRMEMFSVSESYQNEPENRKEISWLFLEESAPNLQTFELYLSPDDFLPEWLFGDCAPLLRTFSVQGNHYVFDTMAPWLKNLSHVTICGCLAFGEVVGALEEMPSLVTLKICCNETDLDVAGPVINLPQLKKLTLCFRSDMLNGVALLERIKPASDCCICIPGEPAEWSPAPEEEEYERYEDAISAHVLPYLKTHPPTVVYVVVTYDTLFLQEGSSASPDPEHLYPGFRIPFYIEFFGSSLLMQELIDSASFSNVTELHLSRWGESPYYEDVDVVSALRAFPSVITLKTTDRVLGLLLENPTITATLFPALVTLDTRDPEGFQPGKEEPAQHRFMKLRKAVGRPVSVLELSFLFGNIPDMDYLEEHTGLLVKWSSRLNGDGEYRCGDGGQEVLRFHSNVWEDEEAGWKLFCAQYSL